MVPGARDPAFPDLRTAEGVPLRTPTEQNGSDFKFLVKLDLYLFRGGGNMEISTPAWIIGSVLMVWTLGNEIRAFRHKRRDRSMVKLLGSGHLCRWNLLLISLVFLGMIYAVAAEDWILLAVCSGVLFISNLLFLYVGKDGVLIGGVLYPWDRVEHFSIQSSRFDNTSAYRHSLYIKLKNWPWKVYASMTDGEFGAVRQLGIDIGGAGTGGATGDAVR